MPSRLKLILLAMTGNVLEFYDFALYGVLVPIISPLFFPQEDAWLSQFIALSVMMVGFLSRPLGAILFGHIGDRLGRKKALNFSIMCMAFCVLGIGLLPTYEMIGIAAPLLLTVLRFLQGLSAGGESNGSVVFVMEHFPSNSRGLASSFMSSAAIAGVLLATFVAAMVSKWGVSFGWRLAFFAGGIIGFVSFYIRRIFEESPVFLKVVSEKQTSRRPFWEVLRHHPHALLTTFGISIFAGAVQLTFAGYMNLYLIQVKGMDFSFVSLINAGCLGVYIFILPVAGFLADRIRADRLLLGSAVAGLICSWPIYMLLASTDVVAIVIAQLWLGVITAFYIGPKSVTLYHLFSGRLRYTGVSFGYAAGVSIFGGATPMVCSYLAREELSPAIFLSGCACLSIWALLTLKPHKEK